MLILLLLLPLILRLLTPNKHFKFLQHLIVSADEGLLTLRSRLLKLWPYGFPQFYEDGEALLVKSINLLKKLCQSFITLPGVGIHFLGLFRLLLLLHNSHVEVH